MMGDLRTGKGKNRSVQDDGRKATATATGKGNGQGKCNGNGKGRGEGQDEIQGSFTAFRMTTKNRMTTKTVGAGDDVKHSAYRMRTLKTVVRDDGVDGGSGW